MSTVVDSLAAAASRLDDVAESARYAASVLDGVSDGLVDRAMDLVRRADDVRVSVVRARDALDQAGL